MQPEPVLVITNDFPPRTGGIESFALEMVRRLARDRRVVVHTARQRGDRDFDQALQRELAPSPRTSAEPGARGGVLVVRDPSPLLVPTPAITRRVVATATRYGCRRVWFAAAAPLALMASSLRAHGVMRMVATTHGHEVWWATLPGSRQLLRRIGERTDVLTYLGEFTRARVAAALTPEAVSTMRRLTPGVDASVFSPGVDGGPVRAKHGLGDDPVIVCVSRMVARKGQDTLVRALPQVLARLPSARLLLVGDGPHRGAVERLAAHHRVTHRVVFAGRRPWAETAQYYAAGTVFAMPTRTRLAGLEPEALGICYLEAAATGLPVVAGDSGGAPDALLAGENGYVVDGRSVAAVADRLLELLLDPGLCARFGARGRAWVQQEWAWQHQAGVLAELLDGPLPDRPARRTEDKP